MIRRVVTAAAGLIAVAGGCTSSVASVSTTSHQIGYSTGDTSFVVDVSTAVSQPLRPPAHSFDELPVVLAPGGEREAYIRMCPSAKAVTCGLYVADRGGAHARRVWTMAASFEPDDPPGSNDYPTPVWSPDGSKVAFVDPGDGNLGRPDALVVADADGDGVRIIRPQHDPENDEALAWSPDGSRLAYWTYSNGLAVTTIRTGATIQLAATVNCDGFTLSWAPDEQSLLGDAECPNDSVTGSVQRSGLFRFALPSAAQPALDLPLALLPSDDFSPIVVPLPPAGLADNGGTDAMEAALSPDGTQLAVRQQEPTLSAYDDPFRIIVIDEATGASRTVVTGNAYYPQLTGWVRS